MNSNNTCRSATITLHNHSGYILWAKFKNDETLQSAKEGLSRVDLHGKSSFVVRGSNEDIIYATIFYQAPPTGPLEPLVSHCGITTSIVDYSLVVTQQLQLETYKTNVKSTQLSTFRVENDNEDPMWVCVGNRADLLAKAAEEVMCSESGRQPFVAAKLGYVCIETEKSHTFRPYGHASTVFISIFCDSEDEEFQYVEIAREIKKRDGFFIQ